LKLRADRVKDPKLSADTPATDLPFEVAAAYWLDLRGYQPHELAKELKQRMLILHGGRDYQVTSVDFENWKKSLAGRPNVVLKEYPKLNHLFIEGEGLSSPAEYNIPGHVAAEVITDIAEWIGE
jgi:dienelactone hydrolase